ncbi:HNH endonuclease [Staphylococcus succinus]|uniref:HNH endonuclease n=1 Tax=Staphylococcus succinus TaxID=61015 RepID=UPI00069D8BC6|nr:HNH endonuclease signature motif containing protein [Staphylococcus succinus]MDH9160510.1 HNH endonuclease signature motif containing protein [Staphylococcus succinus]PNZ17523.1 HNH endonuclease [Staphylococcus succinus subsp. succinus]RIN34656.1 HNH endonuclease [Staphylococcus succinus]
MAVFYVFQGLTYDIERKGGYVWSPQLTKNGKKNAGYSNMTKIKKGDFILHNQNGKVIAISVAKDDCKEANQPSELMEDESSSLWNNEGYLVQLIYYPFDVNISTADFRQWLIDNYKKNSAFGVDGKGKQQYMCNLAEEHAVFILEKAIEIQENPEVLLHLKGALSEIVDEKNPEYDQVEKDLINIDLENKINEDQIDTETSKFEPQTTTISNSTGREIPKRNPKKAVAALILADYKCEYNPEDRTFTRKNGKEYTEPHHLIPISKYREFDRSLDVKENIVSLCSHCHNLIHYGRLEEKKEILEKLLLDRQDQLSKYGIFIDLEQLYIYYK